MVSRQDLYSAFVVVHSRRSAWITQFYCKLYHTFLYLVSVHQTAPPLIVVADIKLPLTTHLSIPKGQKAELAWLTDLWRTVYPHKWSPISCKQVERRTGKVRWSKTVVLPLSHATKFLYIIHVAVYLSVRLHVISEANFFSFFTRTLYA